ncbi:immunoglobulin superfamily member 3-like [Gadus chalcogrammus]|uniref:immunoglobulin superfamily member 3-like n=1 Tax=Gadus chalcogrammus TaxID=1042646 RepID=UPI0024C4AD3B|nr:immunoglobulin superfamily member 3-like [Gadus chalcogrammus]
MRSFTMARYLRTLLLGLLHIQCGARVLTEVPSGPLYRVAGHPLRVPCNVSGFRDAEREKGFQVLMQEPEKTMDINVISARDPHFAWGKFSGRVKSREITLAMLAPNSALFTIGELKASDEGEYECVVVNDETAYDGTYSAKIKVKVIDNTLTVSSPDHRSLSLDEGDPLTLTCQASSNTVQHTHLSVTWYLRMDGEEPPQPIVSLDKDLTPSPGPRFRERYGAGGVRLDKVAEATYRLTIAQLEPSDQGRVYCQAREWIQEPDRSWYPITQKDSETTELTVKAKDQVGAEQGSLSVRLSVRPEALQEGQELALTCSVEGLAARQSFSVAWLRDGSELARFGPTGVLHVGAEHGDRHTGGQLLATKTGPREHLLVLRPVRVQDQGGYACRAWPQDRNEDESFTQGQYRDSPTQVVSISATASELSVQMGGESVAVTEGGRLQLTCRVTGFRGRLSVTWEHKSASPSRQVVGLSQEGVVEPGPDFAQRDVRARRPAADTFTLELEEVRPSDAGTYGCTVSDWTVKPTGDVELSHSQEKTCTVNVGLLENTLRLTLKGRDTAATLGGDVELWCHVKAPRIPMTLTWTLRRDGSPPDKLLELSPDGAITWRGGRQQRYQLRVERLDETVLVHKLRIAGATPSEAGRYQCEASVFLEKRHKKMNPSNELAVMVTQPGSKLSLDAQSISGLLDADVVVTCSVTETTPGNPSYAVTWREERDNRTLLVSSRDGVVTPGAQATPGDEQRISMQQREGPRFELTIRRARVGDSGSYSCVVVEWLQDPNDNWFDLPPVRRTMTVQISEPVFDMQVDHDQRNLRVTEGDDVDLNCSMTKYMFGPGLAFSLAWFYTGPLPGENVTLAELSPEGLLTRPRGGGPGRRLTLSRPHRSDFRLSLQSAQPGDGGHYWCRVEQHRLGQEGRWQRVAVDTSGRTHLTVGDPEVRLSVGGGGEVNMTVAASHDFTVPCDIIAQSSPYSAFNVTWFWKREADGETRPLFTAHPDGTLQDVSGRGCRLRFHRPRPALFSLTVSGAVPEDGGRYHCRVEEWLLSPSRRRVGGVQRSEELRVNIQGNMHPASDSSSSAILPGVLTGLIVLLLVVVGVLILKIRQGPNTGARKKTSLWTEGVFLKDKPPKHMVDDD